MVCRNCSSDRILSVNGKTSDLNYIQYKGYEIDGYVPRDLGIGGGDYLKFNYCLDCGQVQGTFPIDEETVLMAFGVDDEDDWE